MEAEHTAAGPADSSAITCWRPLASSPHALTTFAARLGTARVRFDDVLGLDAEALALLPSPPIGMLLIYPTSTEAQSHLDSIDVKTSGMTSMASSNLFQMRQLLGGTCGTIAALHLLLNLPDEMAVEVSAPLRRRLFPLQHEEDSATADVDAPHEREQRLCAQRSEAMLASDAIREAHDLCATASSVAEARAGERQGRHYVAFVRATSEVNGSAHASLMILDGRRERPICCGPTTSASFADDVAREVRALVAAATSLTPGSAEHGTKGSQSLAFSLIAASRADEG